MASVLLATLREPPTRGSYRETVLLHLVLLKEQIEVARTRASIQAAANPEKAAEAYKEFFELACPWVRSAQRFEDKEKIEFLKREIAKGPLNITPMQQVVRSRMNEQVKKLPAAVPTSRRRRARS